VKHEVLVLGAGGFLGLNTVRACLDAGLKPRCGRRPRGNVLGLRGLDVTLVPTEFHQGGGLEAAMAGVDTVLHLAAHYPRFSLEPLATIERGLRELEVVLEAAASAKVRRLVFVSSTATVATRAEGPSTEADVYPASPSWGTYHQLKWALEDRLARETRFEVSLALPAACLGPYDWKVGTSALVLSAAKGQVPPHPRGRVSTVDARDVGAALVQLCLAKAPVPRVILSGETEGATELFTRFARRYGAPLPAPALTAADACALADEEERQARVTGKRPRIARELVDLIIHAPALDTSLATRLGFTFRSLNETLDDWEKWAQRMGMISLPTPVQTP